jgi:hypothetical protein
MTRGSVANVKWTRNTLLYIYLGGETVMNRISRTAIALALSTTLFAVTAPAAQARGFANPQVPTFSGSWLDAALAWVGNLAIGAPQTREARSMAKSVIPITPPSVPIHGATPMTCSTIDPNGALTCHGGV